MAAKGVRTAKKGLNKKGLGRFSNFPTNIHGIVRASFSDQPARIQRSIVQALYELNGSERTYPVALSSRSGTYSGRVGFEVGIAEGIYFNYLDDKMSKELRKSITPGSLYPTLDFMIVVTYHYNREGRNVRLNFDYHQIRFSFSNEGLEIRLFHNKGTRRMPLDELINGLLDLINKEMEQQSIKPLKVEEIKVL